MIDIYRESKTGTTFIAAINYEIVTVTTQKPMFLLRNPASSGKILIATLLHFGLDSVTSRGFFETYLSPTVISSGTPIAPSAGGAGLGAPPAKAAAYKYPSIGALGSLVASKLLAANSSSKGQRRAFTLGEGTDLLITVQNTVGNTKTFIQVYWMEL